MVACPQLGQRNHSPSAGAFISFKFLIFDTIRATDGVGAIGSDAFTLLMRALHFWWTGRPWSLVTVASRVGGVRQMSQAGLWCSLLLLSGFGSSSRFRVFFPISRAMSLRIMHSQFCSQQYGNAKT
jgi:hypothetical protein